MVNYRLLSLQSKFPDGEEFTGSQPGYIGARGFW
jgi:hypothetical protein